MKKHLLQCVLAIASIAAPAGLSAAEFTLTSDPAAGEVRNLNQIKVSTRLTNSDENVLAVNPEKLSTITLTKDGGETVVCQSAETDVDSWPMNTVILSFGEITEDGDYTMHIPAGTVTETAIDFNTGAPAYSDTDSSNNEFTAVYTVNSEMRMLDAVTFNPPMGSTLSEIDAIIMTFDKLSSSIGYALQLDYDKVATASNGNKTVNIELTAWGNTVYLYPEETISESGMWMVKIPAGTFTYEGEQNEEYAAFYIIEGEGGEAGEVTFDPANGSQIALNTEYATHVYFTFDASEVELVNADGDPSTFTVQYGGLDLSRRTSLSTALSQGGYYIQSYGDEELHFVFSPQTFTRPGVLTITSEEGDFTVDGNPSPAIDYSITVGEVRTYTYNIVPASGSEISIEDLNEILISFPEAKTGEIDDYKFYGILRTSGWISPYCDATVVEDAECATFSLKFGITQTSPGNYSLLLDEGSFILDGNQMSPEITASFTVKKDASNVNTEWAASPTGKLVNESYGFNGAIVFNENETLGRGSAYSQIKGYFNGEEVSALQTSMEGVAFMFMVGSQYGGQEGTFRIVAPEGAFNISGVASPEIDYTWEVVTPKEYNMVFTPGVGSVTNNLGEIFLEIPNAESVTVGEYSLASLRKNDYSYFQSAKMEVLEGQDVPTIKMVFDPAPSVDGDYTLIINYGTMLIDGAQSNDAINATFTLDSSYVGIKGVTAAHGSTTFDIYTIEGRCIGRAADAETVRSLAPGFYIINGKKTLVK